MLNKKKLIKFFESFDSYQEAAKALGITYNTIYKLRTGKRNAGVKVISALQKYCAKNKINFSDFLN